MINLSDYPIFEAEMETLADTAIDPQHPHEAPLTLSCLPAVNFDRVKDKHVSTLSNVIEQPSSVDALLQFPESVAMVEFKNGEIDNKTQRNLRDKVRDSLLIFCEITNIYLIFILKSQKPIVKK